MRCGFHVFTRRRTTIVNISATVIQKIEKCKPDHEHEHIHSLKSFITHILMTVHDSYSIFIRRLLVKKKNDITVNIFFLLSTGFHCRYNVLIYTIYIIHTQRINEKNVLVPCLFFFFFLNRLYYCLFRIYKLTVGYPITYSYTYFYTTYL